MARNTGARRPSGERWGRNRKNRWGTGARTLIKLLLSELEMVPLTRLP
jgi:hypothetical protein